MEDNVHWQEKMKAWVGLIFTNVGRLFMINYLLGKAERNDLM